MLSPRADTILKSIVGQYIAQATPVPSQSIVKDYGLGVSSATIRNEMAHLEDEGYITRPYPSAGSIPLDKGYRYYVESLADTELPLAEQHLISHLFHQVEKELEEWLSLAATLLAQSVHNMALVTTLKPINCQFKHLGLIALHDSLVLIVLVLQGGNVKQQLVSFDQVISQWELTTVANKLNAAYSGLTNSQILAEDVELLPIEQQITDCLAKMMQAEDEQEYGGPCVDGLHFMLNQPEFIHSRQMLAIMELIERRSLMRTILPHHQPVSPGVQTFIGKENEAEVIHNYSVVISQYGLPEEAVGTIGVIGPTRMPYDRTISAVGYLSSVLSRLVTELCRG